MSRSRPGRPSLMSSCTGMLSTTAKRSPASSICAISVPRRARLQASPTATSYSALTTPVTPGICRMWASGIGSAAPNQRKLGITCGAAPPPLERWRALGSGGRVFGGLAPERRRRAHRVGDEDRRWWAEGRSERSGVGCPPQRLAVVQVEADGYALGARTGDGVREHGGRSVAQRRGDPRRVEPVGAREHPRPVDGTRLDASQRGTRAVVHDAHGAQVRARLHEVDPEALTTPLDPFGADSFSLERRDARAPDGIVGYARDVVASHAAMAQGDRHVRLCPAEARHEVARLEQSFFPGRAEPQEQLAERDHPRHGVLPRWRRASATRSTNDRARAVSSAAEPSASRAALASALPTLTAAAPARIQSPAFSSDTPPEGTSRRKGSGASTSRT